MTDEPTERPDRPPFPGAPLPERATDQLPVWELAIGGWRELYAQSWNTLRLMAVPLVANVVIQYRTTSATIAEMQSLAHEGDAPLGPVVIDGWFFLYTVLGWLVLAAAMTTWQRMVLLGEAPPKPFGITFDRRELRLFGYMLAVFAAFAGVYMLGLGLATIPIIIGGALGESFAGGLFIFMGTLAVGVAVALALVALIRWTLVMPAIALDAESGLVLRLKAAWQLGRGHTGRLALALLLASLPMVLLVAAVFIPLLTVSLQDGDSATFMALIVISTVFGLISYMVYAAIYALAYRRLMRTDILV